MSKRDNPRLKERLAEKERAAKEARARYAKRTEGGKTYGERKSYGDRKPYGERKTYSERKPYDSGAEREAENTSLIIGRNPVMEAIKAGRTINKIEMQKDGEGSIKKIASMAREKGIQIQYVDKIVLDKLVPGRPHQGIAAFMAAHDYVNVDDILKAAEEKGEDPLIVILDGLEDPHNLGAVLRSADGCGAHGVIIPSRRAVALTETVAKASAGAIEYVPVAKVSNLAQTIDELKEKGIWIASVDMDGVNYSQATLTGPLALVIGGEGSGVSRLIREKSDYIVSIPMKGKVNSLNASNAAAIMLYEAVRQRDAEKAE